MKNANEMRAITDSVNEAFEARQKKLALDTVENRIMPNIEFNAVNGLGKLHFQIDAHINPQMVIDILVENDYVVASTGNFITIYW